jgi:hypothetical protein
MNDPNMLKHLDDMFAKGKAGPPKKEKKKKTPKEPTPELVKPPSPKSDPKPETPQEPDKSEDKSES